MKYNLYLAAITVLLFLGSCSDNEDEIDTQPPVIDMSISDAFPTQCAVLQRGKSYDFVALFTDNFALGSYSLDIHHNFDHHTHSTEVNDCEMAPVKAPVNPWLVIEGFPLPSGEKSYRTKLKLQVPEDIDTGDYHFLIKLTDKEGWQTISGISIKVQ